MTRASIPPATATAKLLLGAALAATVLMYWVGLGGAFVMDDGNNLAPIKDWLHGDNTWRHALLGNTSGPFGRSLSMATLMANAWLGGFSPYAFKLGNLLFHLACGWVGWQVLRRTLARDRHLAANADLIASLLTALWLLHPLNVSTVLYSVQRMAQVSTLFTLAALWAYLSARMALAEGRTRSAAFGLFLWFPLLLITGLLGKENTAVAPVLCLLLEASYFCGAQTTNRLTASGKHRLWLFYGVFLIVPAGLVLTALALHPARVLDGYNDRDFSLVQRLLSEPRALMDYVGALVFPQGPRMGVYNDDFAISSGWLSPPSTLWAVLALVGITVLAVGVRKHAPSVFAGWLFFLIAHSVESTFLPLELYYEHRNYLPAFGLLLACIGTAELLSRPLHNAGMSRRRLGLFAIGAYGLVLAFATHARAWVWGDEGRMLTQEVRYHPGSMRANVALAYYDAFHGRLPQGRQLFDGLLAQSRPRTREQAYLNRVLFDCVTKGSATPSDLHDAVALAQPRVTLGEMFLFLNLTALDAERPCAGAGARAQVDAIEGLLAATPTQPDSQTPKWHLRLMAADMAARTGDWKRALIHARLAWQPTADAAVGGFLVRVFVHNGQFENARKTYAQVANRIHSDDTRDRQGLAELKAYIDQAMSNATQPPAKQ